MRPASIGRVIFLSWVAAEFATYAVFFSIFPIWAGVLVGLGSILLGLVTLRLLGARVMQAATAQLMEAAINGSARTAPLALLGAVLLLLPGFLSDLLGVALVIAGAGALLRRPASADARSIDLEDHEWTRLPDDAPRR